MKNDKHSKILVLRRLYLSKCGQIAKAEPSSFRCQVLKAEAYAIKVELDIA